jgi:hypothetical protein
MGKNTIGRTAGHVTRLLLLEKQEEKKKNREREKTTLVPVRERTAPERTITR